MSFLFFFFLPSGVSVWRQFGAIDAFAPVESRPISAQWDIYRIFTPQQNLATHNIYTSLVSKNIFQEYYTLVVIIARKTPLGAHIVHRTHCTLVRKWEYFHNGQNISLSTICNLSLTSRVWMSENLDSRQYPTYCWKPHYFECVLWWHEKQKTGCLISMKCSQQRPDVIYLCQRSLWKE